jgi:hypothetical protein
MKSGPTLNGATFSPLARSQARSPKVRVVLPAPLPVAAMTMPLMMHLLLAFSVSRDISKSHRTIFFRVSPQIL